MTGADGTVRGPVLVLGMGQLGAAAARATETGGLEVRLVGRDTLDVEDARAIEPFLRAARPTLVINATGYTLVDEAERQPDRAFRVNATAPGMLARATAALGMRLVHVSTDYVFGDGGERPFREGDLPAPLGVYGASKLAGEHLVLAYAPDALVVRTSAVFGEPAVVGQGTGSGKRTNFVRAILRRARAGERLRVVDDQRTCPTYAPDLAEAILALVNRAGARGLVHARNAGSCTWYQFACAIVEEAGLTAEVDRIGSASLGLAARRPAFSVLDCGKLAEMGVSLPPWRDALRRYLAAIGEEGNPRRAGAERKKGEGCDEGTGPQRREGDAAAAIYLHRRKATGADRE